MQDELGKCQCAEMLYGNERYMEKINYKNMKDFKLKSTIEDSSEHS